MTDVAMSPGTAALALFGMFFFLIILRVPVAFALGLACLPPLLFDARLSPMVLFNETFKSYNSFILLAVPFFLLTANLMNVGGITDRLVHLSRTMVGNWPGSLAQINVLLSVFFAGISGSSTADADATVRRTSIAVPLSDISCRIFRRKGDSTRCFTSSALKSLSWSFVGRSPFRSRYATSSYSALVASSSME